MPRICPSFLTPVVIIFPELQYFAMNGKIFVSFQKPYNSVSKATISRCICTAMEEACIDITHLGLGLNNVPVENILITAWWNNASVFYTFIKNL